MKPNLLSTLMLSLVLLPQLVLTSRSIDRQSTLSSNLAPDDRTTPNLYQNNSRIVDAADDSLTPKQVQDIAQKITVRVTATSGNNGGSGVQIGRAHV